MQLVFDGQHPDFIGEAEAIEFLGLAGRRNPLGTLKRLCRTGLPHYRPLRGVYRFNPHELAAWLKDQHGDRPKRLPDAAPGPFDGPRPTDPPLAG